MFSFHTEKVWPRFEWTSPAFPVKAKNVRVHVQAPFPSRLNGTNPLSPWAHHYRHGKTWRDNSQTCEAATICYFHTFPCGLAVSSTLIGWRVTRRRTPLCLGALIVAAQGNTEKKKTMLDRSLHCCRSEEKTKKAKLWTQKGVRRREREGVRRDCQTPAKLWLASSISPSLSHSHSLSLRLAFHHLKEGFSSTSSGRVVTPLLSSGPVAVVHYSILSLKGCWGVGGHRPVTRTERPAAVLSCPVTSETPAVWAELM